jgi:hypothetical protein
VAVGACFFDVLAVCLAFSGCVGGSFVLVLAALVLVINLLWGLGFFREKEPNGGTDEGRAMAELICFVA